MPATDPNKASANLPMVFTVEIDPDHYDSSFSSGDSSTGMGWRGLTEAVPRLRGFLSSHPIIDGTRTCNNTGLKTPIKATWFVRVDDQIGEVHGDMGYLLDAHRSLWEEVSSQGDEIGLHVHLYQRSKGQWVQDTDPARIEDQLGRAYAAMTSRGFTPVSCRIGDAFQSNATMEALEKFQLQIDSTAMPGRVRNDGGRTLDWSPTPNHPYQPSRADYRVPGTPSWDILEVPVSMVETQTDYDTSPLNRYLELTFRPEVLQPGLPALMESAPLLHTILHPSGMIGGMLKERHGLIAFDEDVVGQNLDSVLACAEGAGRTLHSVTMSECRALFARAESQNGLDDPVKGP